MEGLKIDGGGQKVRRAQDYNHQPAAELKAKKVDHPDDRPWRSDYVNDITVRDQEEILKEVIEWMHPSSGHLFLTIEGIGRFKVFPDGRNEPA